MTLKVIDSVLSDRGSKYAVSGSQATSKKEAQRLVKELCKVKKFAKATHNSWGLITQDGTQIKQDDGEGGAGAIILKMLNERGLKDHLVIVTRWYGGVHLGGDRFRHVKACVSRYFEEVGQKV